MIDVGLFPRGIPALAEYLKIYCQREGRVEGEEKVLDWLVPLYELASLGQNVAEAVYHIEAACAAAGLDFRTLKKKAQAEAQSRRKEDKAPVKA